VVGSLPKGKGDVQGVLVLGEVVAILVRTGGPGSELELFKKLLLSPLSKDYRKPSLVPDEPLGLGTVAGLVEFLFTFRDDSLPKLIKAHNNPFIYMTRRLTGLPG